VCVCVCVRMHIYICVVYKFMCTHSSVFLYTRLYTWVWNEQPTGFVDDIQLDVSSCLVARIVRVIWKHIGERQNVTQ